MYVGVQGGLRMAASDTKGDVLRYLDRATREVYPNSAVEFTTAKIAGRCHISRNLASQYLNELVRDGLVVKVGVRPRLFMHRASLERCLQARLARSEYTSLEELLASVGATRKRDFEKALGCDMSLGVCIEQLRSAISYPPHGLPVLLVGDHGTGKEFLANLSFEYGVNSGTFPPGARFVKIDCSRYEESDGAAEADIFGGGGVGGAVQQARDGVVFVSRFDHLAHTTSELIVNRILEGGCEAEGAPAQTRFILSTARFAQSARVSELSRMLPIGVHLPRYAERDADERTALVLHFLRAEGRRAAADVSISRGALRALVAADFDENIDGLKSCIATCCASAYLNRIDERMVIRSYNLPLHLLGATKPEVDDDQLVSGTKPVSPSHTRRILGFFQRLVELYQAYESNELEQDELVHGALETMHDYEDYLSFDGQGASARVAAYEQVLNPIIESLNSTYGIEFNRKRTRVLAQSLSVQLWGGAKLVRWYKVRHDLLMRMAETLRADSSMVGAIFDQIGSGVRSALGVELSDAVAVMLLLEVTELLAETSEARDAFGIVLCHGYATATSMADAANKMLHRHVFEAIDMTYDQQVSDVAVPLSRMLERYSFARTVAILVDMGSLSQVTDVVAGIPNGKIYVVSNVSTGLALEIGGALVSHGSIDEVMSMARDTCAPTYRVIDEPRAEEAIAFSSEAGDAAAQKLRDLVRDSLPEDLPMGLVACDYHELSRMGDHAPIFSAYRVRALVGTMDPGIVSVPFVALEDILCAGSSEALDNALRTSLGPEGIAAFHRKLLRNVTLKNVLESITILNPEMLYLEADRAIQKLSTLRGKPIDSRRQIGLYVHLCGLIERLVTKNFVDAYPGDLERFQGESADFIAWFRQSFDDMCRRYRVEIPLSEVAYVFHMLHAGPEDEGPCGSLASLTLEDE